MDPSKRAILAIGHLVLRLARQAGVGQSLEGRTGEYVEVVRALAALEQQPDDACGPVKDKVADQ